MAIATTNVTPPITTYQIALAQPPRGRQGQQRGGLQADHHCEQIRVDEQREHSQQPHLHDPPAAAPALEVEREAPENQEVTRDRRVLEPPHECSGASRDDGSRQRCVERTRTGRVDQTRRKRALKNVSDQVPRTERIDGTASEIEQGFRQEGCQRQRVVEQVAALRVAHARNRKQRKLPRSLEEVPPSHDVARRVVGGLHQESPVPIRNCASSVANARIVATAPAAHIPSQSGTSPPASHRSRRACARTDDARWGEIKRAFYNRPDERSAGPDADRSQGGCRALEGASRH